MRAVTVTGREDGLTLALGQDTSLIAEIMTRGRYIPDLIYELELSGAELRTLLASYAVDAGMLRRLVPQNTYTVTAYDW